MSFTLGWFDFPLFFVFSILFFSEVVLGGRFWVSIVVGLKGVGDEGVRVE